MEFARVGPIVPARDLAQVALCGRKAAPAVTAEVVLLPADAGSCLLGSEGWGLPVLVVPSGEVFADGRGSSSGLGGVAGGGGVDGAVGISWVWWRRVNLTGEGSGMSRLATRSPASTHPLDGAG